jgi:hypothetical protein
MAYSRSADYLNAISGATSTRGRENPKAYSDAVKDLNYSTLGADFDSKKSYLEGI